MIPSKQRKPRKDRPLGTRHPAATLLVLAAFLGSALPLARAESTAHLAHVLTGTATAKLHLTRAEGSMLIEEGPVTGALTGTAKAWLQTGTILTARFTIQTRYGSISGQGHASPHGSGRYISFAGTFTTTGGTGRYAHVHGKAGLYGVFDRRTEAVTIQATGGTLTY